MKYSLKELRARKNETQLQTSKALGVCIASYNSWERKGLEKVQLGKVIRIAEHFGVSLDEIKA